MLSSLTDDDTQQDMFDNDSEGELVEEETDTDFKWRKERFEREQFLQEQQVGGWIDGVVNFLAPFSVVDYVIMKVTEIKCLSDFHKHS